MYAIFVIFRTSVVNAFVMFMNTIHNIYECFQYVDFSTTSHANLYTYYSCVKSITIIFHNNWMQLFRIFTVKFSTFVTFFVGKCNSHSLNILQAVAPISDYLHILMFHFSIHAEIRLAKHF